MKFPKYVISELTNCISKNKVVSLNPNHKYTSKKVSDKLTDMLGLCTGAGDNITYVDQIGFNINYDWKNGLWFVDIT